MKGGAEQRTEGILGGKKEIKWSEGKHGGLGGIKGGIRKR